MKSVHQIEPCGQIPVANTALVAMMESERKDQVHEAKVLLTRQKIDAAGKRSPETAEVSPFNFGEHPVRVMVREGEPWFVCSDVAETLGYRDSHNAARHLDADEKGTQIVSTPGGDQKLTIINESGLYALVLRSRKPEARKFAKWVTSEVLPQIRKTGVYLPKEFAVNPGDVLTKEQQDALRQLVKTTADRLPKAKQGPASIKMWSKLKAHFGVAYREIPQAEFTEAVSLLTRAATEWELVDDDEDEAAARAEREKKASSVAAEVGAVAYRTVFKAVMDSDEDIETNRWVFGLRHGNFGRSDVQDEPWAQLVPRNACIASLADIAKMINEPNGMVPEQGDLIALLLACATRIRDKLPEGLRI
ncbi:Bro-N domain-containing protein [Achromobacter sp. Marseille-Q0513]|uniref:BRO-N domain-containing protein n=1 Tax=Achromobacter sp. Marseille-Q0513 TaxID=2829161 RepID=UPI001BA257C4|nr:Bro-N domain-containing protein [Achromobacter sp. Marseille-Q0513]MBR8654283.1 Bro-N domain-containing protein [Achromobacter sp. Marseille-Q0513]